MKAPAQQRTFLTAEWKNLVMLNYAVDPVLLQSYVPSGTELDQFECVTYLSLIGFEFNKIQVMGHAVPFHQSFEEVNLRFYVRRGSRRGVVFIRELVPKYAVSALARLAYGERYSCVPMSHRVHLDADTGTMAVEFSWGSGAGGCSIEAQASSPGYLPEQGSLGEFITEHYWGYTARGEWTLEYQVEHPQWHIRQAEAARFSGDAQRYYGQQFTRVLAQSPDSAFIAEGSAVTVFKGTPIT